MIVVVEGIDRVGKTTLVNKLVKAGFISLKDEFVLPKTLIDDFSSYSIGKCDSFVAIAKKLDAEGKNIVIDRLHLTELVYGEFIRHSVDKPLCWAIDMELANLGAYLVLVNPNDINLSNKEAGMDQREMCDAFNAAFKISSILHKVTCTYDNLDEVAHLIISSASEYDFYFASPFFTPEQIEREERMKKHLRSFGFRVFSPKEACNLGAKASQSSRKEVFESNCNAIRKSRIVFAVTDGKDMGTIWEAGFAYGINKPVVYFAETLGDNPFNLMLAQSGLDVFTSQEQVNVGSLCNILNCSTREYRGDIE